MAIELSNLTFTDEDDIVPASGVEQIFNTGFANTFAGNDIITGTVVDAQSIHNTVRLPGWRTFLIPGIYNDTGGMIDTGEGDDIITGLSVGREGFRDWDEGDYGHGIINRGTIDTGNGNDIITGTSQDPNGYNGITNHGSGGVINTGDGDDTLVGTGEISRGIDISLNSTLDTGNGNDIIVGNAGVFGIINGSTTFNTGDGNDVITGNAVYEGISNTGFMNTGDGDDIITGSSSIIPGSSQRFMGIYSSGRIDTGNGDDIITSIGEFVHSDIIDTGNGNDSIIAEVGFFSHVYTGRMFLGEGKDYVKGFGEGIFYGGNCEDTLELTSGSYTVGRWDETVTFSKGSNLMITSEFEILIAGSSMYHISELTEGDTIFIA